MAEIKTMEREYIIPLKREWVKVPYYKRASKSTKAVKQFIAKHMKVADRDLDKVKLDVYLNNELWARGARKAMGKVKVRAVKEGEIVRVTLVEMPETMKYSRVKSERRHSKAPTKKESKEQEKAEGKTIEEKVEEKKNEVEKEKSVEQMNEKLAAQSAKTQKHASKIKSPEIHRMALKK